MTDTQFQVGETYETVGGEIAKIERIVDGLLYGDVRESRWHSAIWTLDGGYEDLGAEHDKALVLPEADDKAELLAALAIATDALEGFTGLTPCRSQDPEYIRVVKAISAEATEKLALVRAAIAKAERTS